MRHRTLATPLWLVATLVIVAACATPAPEPSPTPVPAGSQPAPAAGGRLPQEVTLGIGQEAELARGAVRVRFAGVVSDSRCPAAAHCVRAGEAIVEVAVTTPDATEVVRLGTPSPLTQTAAVVGGYRVELLDVVPSPVSTRPIAESDYRLRLRVSEV